LLYVDHLERRGCGLYQAACERDLDGIVAKWAKGRYHTDGVHTSWIKIKNPTYSYMTGRRELFDRRQDVGRADRRNWRAPVLSL
jgi:ATP-dependent DNA ligase